MRGISKTSVSNYLSLHLRGYEQVIALVLLGVVLRIVISFYTSHPNDEEVWYIAGINMLSGQGSPYGTWYFSYPPAWAYIYLPFLSAASLFSNPHLLFVRMSVGGIVVPVLAPLFSLAVKLPIIIGDVLVGIVIYRLVDDLRNSETAKKAFVFWFFNPLVIYTGAFLAQYDVLPALASLLAFVFFLQRKFLATGASLSIAVMAKVYPVFLAPLYLAAALKPSPDHKIEWRKGIRSFIVLAIGALSVAGLLLIPVFSTDTFRGFIEGLFRRSSYITSVGGPTPLDVLWLFGDPIQWSNEYGRPQQIYAILTALQGFGVLLVLLFFVFYSKQEPLMKSFLRSHVCILVLVLLTSLTVNPQYVLWIMPFLILDYGLYGNYKIRLLLLSASGVFLSFNWAYPFHPITAFVNRDVGMALNNVLNLSLYPSTYFPIVIFFGLLGGAAIVLLPFPNLRIRKPKNLLKEKPNKSEIDSLLGLKET